MDFLITDEQKEYIKEVICFAKENLNDESGQDSFSPEMWEKISEFGFLGISADPQYGGLGESYLTAALMTEALGYACENNGFTFVVNNHIWVALNLIDQFGSLELKTKYLTKLIEGELIGAFALSESEAGSDAMSMLSFAQPVEGGFLVNGNKMFISNGPIADLFVAVVKTGEAGKMTAFVVEKNFPGVKVGSGIEKMGLDACPISEVQMKDVFIPQENILGRVDLGTAVMTSALEWERCYEFAPHVGSIKRIIEWCMAYTTERKQFGQPIKNFQAVSHKIADMQVAYELARNMLYKVAWLKDQGKSAFREAAIFKLFVSEHYVRTCQSALQIFGAYGYTKEYPIERELRDALACTIYSGTSEVQRNTIFNLA